MFPVLSQTIISLIQTAGHNSQALSMNPFGLHVAGPSDPAFFSENCKNLFLDSLKINSDIYLNQTNPSKDMQTDENEHGEYLDTKKWKLLDINRKTDSRGRIHINEINYEKEIKVFVSDIDQELETCKHYILIPSAIYTEIRKSRKKEQVGEPLKVQKNGDVWTTQKEKYVKIFVRVGE